MTTISSSYAELASAKRRWRFAEREVRRAQLRLRVARLGLTDWAAALILGAGAMAVAAVPAVVFQLNIELLILAMTIASIAAFFIAWKILRFRAEERSDPEALISGYIAKMVEAKAAAAHAVAASAEAIDVEMKKAAELQRRTEAEAKSVTRTVEQAYLLSIDPGRLYPDELERHVARIFRHLGYSCEVIGQSGDQGVDVLALRNGGRVAIQVKRYGEGAVGNSAVQQAYAGMAFYGCHRCAVVTSGRFSKSAKEAAHRLGCVLIDQDDISRLVCGEIF
jgi:HJR/Mrr/RecB family endonuclease